MSKQSRSGSPRRKRTPNVPGDIPVKRLVQRVADQVIALNMALEDIEMERVMNGHKPEDTRPAGPTNPNPRTYKQDLQQVNQFRTNLANRYETIWPLVRERVKAMKEEEESSG